MEGKNKRRVWGEFCGTEAITHTFFPQQSKNHVIIKCWYLFCLNFSLFSLRNYPWCLHPMSFKRGSTPWSHRREGWPHFSSILPFPPAALCSILIIWSSHGDKKGIWVILLGGAKLKLAPNPTELFALISQSLLVIVEWRAAPSHLCRPLQHSESMSQKDIKIVSISHHKLKRWGFTSTHFLIKTVPQLWQTLPRISISLKIWRQTKDLIEYVSNPVTLASIQNVEFMLSASLVTFVSLSTRKHTCGSARYHLGILYGLAVLWGKSRIFLKV